MKAKNVYYCSGVLRGQHQEQHIEAVSEKQAEYFFKKYYGKDGFTMRNVRAEFICAMEECPQGEQLAMHIDATWRVS